MNQPPPGGPLGNQPKNAPDKQMISMLGEHRRRKNIKQEFVENIIEDKVK